MGPLAEPLLTISSLTGVPRKIRFALHVLTGRLSTCPVYEERTATSLHIRSQEGPLRLAADGETFDGGEDLVVAKRPRALLVAVPPTDVDGPERGPQRGR